MTGRGTEASAGRLTLAIYPHRGSRYDLHEEGGNTVAISSDKQGAYDERAAIRVTTSSATKDYLLRIKANFAPSQVTLNGTALAMCADQTAFDDPIGACAWLSEDGRVLVKYSTVGAAATVIVIPGA